MVVPYWDVLLNQNETVWRELIAGSAAAASSPAPERVPGLRRPVGGGFARGTSRGRGVLAPLLAADLARDLSESAEHTAPLGAAPPPDEMPSIYPS
jgi:hypothetical protein